MKQNLKPLAMATTYPINGSADGLPISVTFEAAPSDIIIRKLEVVDSIINESVEEEYINFGSTKSIVTEIRIDGTPIPSAGFGVMGSYGPDSLNSVDLDLALSTGEVLSMDVAITGIGSIAALYTDQPPTLPTLKNFLGMTLPLTPVIGPVTPATATLTVDLSHPGSSDAISFFNQYDGDSGPGTLSPAGGPRGVGIGSNDYDNTGSVSDIAASIADAINDGTNDFSGMFSASDLGAVVTLTAATPGPIGNMLRISNEVADITETSFTGGVMGPDTTITLDTVPATLPIGSVITKIFTFNTVGDGVSIDDFTTITGLTINAGPNLLDFQIYGANTGFSSEGEDMELNIPVSASDTIAITANTYFPVAAVFFTVIIESPQ
jgi:hypothetical protein